MKQDVRKLEQCGDISTFNWRQDSNDLLQMREALDEEKQRRDVKKRELREREKLLINELLKIISDEQQARTRAEEQLAENEVVLEGVQTMLIEEQRKKTTVDEQLSERKIAHTEQEERLQNELEQMRKTLDDKERVMEELQSTLAEEKKAKNAVDEELNNVRISFMKEKEGLQKNLAHMRRQLGGEKSLRNVKEQELKNKEELVENLQRTLEEEQQARFRIDSDLAQIRRTLSEKEGTVDELQRALEGEQQARTAAEGELRQARSLCDDFMTTIDNLEKTLDNEQLSNQSHQRNIETMENVIREQRHRLEEENQRKTALQERLRSLELRMDEERDRHLSIVRQFQAAVAAADETGAESRDWIIQREEVVLSEKILGRGAWGNVREGTFRGCQVAVKEIHALILSGHNRRLFQREMSIAARCRHPNLLQFIGVATDHDGSPLLVTELLDTSLRNLLSDRRLSQDEILILALDVAKGLNYLHLNKPLPILHRDISSANILLWKREETWRAKLSDYGAANFMRQQMTVNPGAMIYSAPEAVTAQQSPKVN